MLLWFLILENQALSVMLSSFWDIMVILQIYFINNYQTSIYKSIFKKLFYQQRAALLGY